MKQSVTILPEGFVNATFAGYTEQEIKVQIEREEELGSYFLALCDDEKKVIVPSHTHKDRIKMSIIAEKALAEGTYHLVVVYEKDGQEKISYLRNMMLTVPDEAKGRIYDRRRLYGTPEKYDDTYFFLPCHQIDRTLAVELHQHENSLYAGQLVAEWVTTEKAFDAEGNPAVRLYVKTSGVQGNYLGLLDREGQILEYIDLEQDGVFLYLSFVMKEEDAKDCEQYRIAWSKDSVVYYAPLKYRKAPAYATITDFTYGNGILRMNLSYDAEEAGEFIEAVWEHENGSFEPKNDVLLQTEKCDVKEGKVSADVSCNLDQGMTDLGVWNLVIRTRQNGMEKILPVAAHGGLTAKNLPTAIGTKYAYTCSSDDGRLQLERKYGHNALFKKNIQQFPKDFDLDDFLGVWGVDPKGDMYAEYLQKEEGHISIRLYQAMSGVLEAKLVILHTLWMGVVAVQDLDVVNGQVQEFEVECPDVDQDNRIEKPMNNVWYRVILALRTTKGIFYSRLKNYDLDTNVEQEGQIHDTRRLYYKTIGHQSLCGIDMTSLPYYANNGLLSIKFVRNDQIYRSQFTNELLNVTIKKDILTVVMRCRDCGGTYKGVLMEYRKVKEDDAETYLVPYESLKEKNGWYIMTTRINMKEHYMRMLYWDIRCAFELDGEIHTVSCHSNNQKFLRKYKNVFVDRSYPNPNSIMFPYATDNASVALMHRETCPQDHWPFRLKEKLAQFVYNQFKERFDSKNAYLIFEKYCTMAQDNGYFFFKYCMDAEVEKTFDGQIYYVIDPKQADWEKVVPYKKHVLKYLSFKHLLYLQACKLMISTDTKGHAYVWRSMGSDIKALTYKKNLVFLQHGVTAFKRGHFERGTNVGCESFITTSAFEQNIIHTYLGYPLEEVPVTGFARWDVLHDKSEGHREILMMPTWRTWLDDAENDIFAESDYCKNYMALLNDPKLDELLKSHDVTLNFYLHPKFRKFITEFSVVSDHIRLIPFGEEPLNELMMQCNLLITDFSSVAWDVYYMNKPVLFYHFDIEEASKTLGFYMDMKNDLFGERAENPGELMSLITEYIENDFAMKEEYAKGREKYFAYVDDNNSERIWQAIQARDWNIVVEEPVE